MNLRSPTACRASLALLALLALGVSIGCREEAPITQYTIDERVPETLQSEQRMLGAIVPKDDSVWFFKMTGPETAVSMAAEPVKQVVQSVSFNSQGEPILDTPEGWKSLPGDGVTYAKYDVPTEDNLLQMTVTRLGKQGDWDELVVANVNRWRGQLGLEPSAEPWAGGEPLEVDAASSEGAVWVDLVGEGNGGGSARPPMMSGMPPFAGNTPSASTPPAASTTPTSAPRDEPQASELEYDLPEGWQLGRSGGMRIAAFEVGEGDARAEVTLIRAGGDMRGNMRMWAGQVKLSENADSAIETALQEGEELTVDGQPAKRFYIEGPGRPARAIDVVVVESETPDEPNLFIKMSGPATTVRQQADAFGKFLESLKL